VSIDDGIADLSQLFRHGGRVILWVLKLGDVLIGSIANEIAKRLMGLYLKHIGQYEPAGQHAAAKWTTPCL
jgi:hypothetical protein